MNNLVEINSFLFLKIEIIKVKLVPSHQFTVKYLPNEITLFCRVIDIREF